MRNIKTFLTDDHRECDEIFATMENEATTSLESASESCLKFCEAMERHFQMEERVMFVEFEAKTGMREGPTQMMRMEHTQMRSIMKQMQEALQEGNSDKFFGLTETLMIYMQQHNMKEEQMLYTMAQQHLSGEAERIVDMMESIVVE